MMSKAGHAHTEKSRTLERSYPLEAQGSLQISNRFGAIRVKTWDKARTTITVTIKVSGRDADYVSARFKDISVDFKADPTRVQANTVIKNTAHRLRLFRSNSVKIRVDYSIQAPKTASLQLKDAYGNIQITDTKGRAHIALRYGSLKADQLADGDLKMNYGTSNHIGRARKLNIDATYSNFQIDTASTVDIKSDYSRYKIKHASSVSCHCNYGSLRIGQAAEVRERGDFHILSADTIDKQLDVRGDYGKVSVKQLSKNFTSVKLEGGYKHIALGIAPSAQFSFDLALKRARFHSNLALHYKDKEEKRGAARYVGWYQKPDNEHSVQVEMHYGFIQLDKAKPTDR